MTEHITKIIKYLKHRYRELREFQVTFFKKQTSLHIIFKPLKNTDKERTLKEGRERKDIKAHYIQRNKDKHHNRLLIRNRAEDKGMTL